MTTVFTLHCYSAKRDEIQWNLFKPNLINTESCINRTVNKVYMSDIFHVRITYINRSSVYYEHNQKLVPRKVALDRSHCIYLYLLYWIRYIQCCDVCFFFINFKMTVLNQSVIVHYQYNITKDWASYKTTDNWPYKTKAWKSRSTTRILPYSKQT